MHILAYVYHWGYTEIKNMPKKERRMFVQLIVAQKKMESDSMKQEE